MLSRIQKSENAQELFLLLFRLWMGLTMIGHGKLLFEKSEWPFFISRFGDELHLPAPLIVFFFAKGSEFLGGILISFGLFTRIAAAFIVFTMVAATLAANRHQIYSGEGAITISFMLFAFVLMLFGSGHWSLDHFLSRRKEKNKVKAFSDVAKKIF
ncbi:MAG: hypothetical protein C5B59_05435 [Bacteroidetes bacterium]|nr:MAG: hypothetical protein C5B59_05435 [Bacteroidota bacterium]